MDDISEEKPDDVEHQTQEKVDSSKNSDVKKETEHGAHLESKDVLSLPTVDSLVNAATSSVNDKEASVQNLPSQTSTDETANVSSPSMAENSVEESQPKKTASQKKKDFDEGGQTTSC